MPLNRYWMPWKRMSPKTVMSLKSTSLGTALVGMPLTFWPAIHGLTKPIIMLLLHLQSRKTPTQKFSISALIMILFSPYPGILSIPPVIKMSRWFQTLSCLLTRTPLNFWGMSAKFICPNIINTQWRLRSIPVLAPFQRKTASTFSSIRHLFLVLQ